MRTPIHSGWLCAELGPVGVQLIKWVTLAAFPSLSEPQFLVCKAGTGQ